MKKLSLSLEQLHVESFELSTERGDRGTVMGHIDSSGDLICAKICLPPMTPDCPDNTFAGPGCYRISDPACSPWTDDGSTC